MSGERELIDPPKPPVASPGPAPTPSPPARRSFGHVPELDGIRGLAIAMVFAFHYVGFQGRGIVAQYLGGAVHSLWCGVDLFFVLSGFLITGILLDARGRPRYFKTFYVRRTLRIFPLYFGLLAFVFLVLPRFVSMTSLRDRVLIANQAWLWTYTSNFRSMIAGQWVFAGDRVWLHHLWSLAVEEHFYLFWPFVVGLSTIAGVRRACWAFIVICPLIRVGLLATSLPPAIAYEATFCRLDALTLGGLLALLVRGQAGWVTARGVKATGGLSAVAILGYFLWRRELLVEDPLVRTLGYTLLAVASAGLILASISAREGGLFRRALRLRPLRELGKYSYGLYVYHVALQPSLEFLSTRSLQGYLGTSFAVAGLLHVAASLAVCLGAAVLSWHLFEKPFLAWKKKFEYAPR